MKYASMPIFVCVNVNMYIGMYGWVCACINQRVEYIEDDMRVSEVEISVRARARARVRMRVKVSMPSLK